MVKWNFFLFINKIQRVHRSHVLLKQTPHSVNFIALLTVGRKCPVSVPLWETTHVTLNKV